MGSFPGNPASDDLEVRLARTSKAKRPMYDGEKTIIWLTTKQRDTLISIGRAYDRGDNPALKDIASDLNKKNTSSAAFLVDALKALGILESTPNQHRSIRMTEFGLKLWGCLRPRFGGGN